MKIDITRMEIAETHTLLCDALSPRLVTLVSTIGSNGVHNVAPFASVGVICYKPPIVYVGISSRQGQKKDTLQNIEYCGDFVLNVVNEDMAVQMNKTAIDYPGDVDEFQVSGLTPVESEKVKSPRVGESPVSMECQMINILQYGKIPDIRSVVLGEVVMVHIKDALYHNCKIDKFNQKAIAHLGGEYYCRTNDIFELKREK